MTISNDNAIKILSLCPNLLQIKFYTGMSIPLNKIKIPDTVERIIYSYHTISNFDLDNVIYPKNLKILTLPHTYGVICNPEKYDFHALNYMFWNLNNLPQGLEKLTAPYFNSDYLNLPICLNKFATYMNTENVKLPFNCKVSKPKII